MNFFDYTSLNDDVVHGLTLFERVIPIVIIVCVLFLIKYQVKWFQDNKKERWIRQGLAVLMILGEISFLVWNYVHSLNGDVRFIDTLPLQLCSYAIWGVAYALFFNNQNVFKYVFVFGVISVLALIVPNLNHGVNSFRYYQLFYSHGLLLIGLFYYYQVHSITITFEEYRKSFVFLQVIIVVSLVLNGLFQTEFLFIGPGNKPIDFAWEWPYQMIQYEAVMLLFYVGTYYSTNKRLNKRGDLNRAIG